MKKEKYQKPTIKVIPMMTNELLAYSYETGDFFTRKKELEMSVEEEEDTPSRFGYWD